MNYQIDGNTKETALMRKIKIERTIFTSAEELDSYANDLVQRLKNLLAFEEISIFYEKKRTDDDFFEVTLNIFLKDACHFMVDPTFSIDSDTGFGTVVFLEDDNFLGTLDRWFLKVFCASEHYNDEDEPTTPSLGFELDWDIPLATKKIATTLNNTVGFKYNFGESEPEFKIREGVTFEIPTQTENAQFVAAISHAIQKELDYEQFGDGLFGTAAAKAPK